MNSISPAKLKIVSGVIFLFLFILVGYLLLPKILKQPKNSTNDLEQSGVPSVTESAPIKVEADSARIGNLVIRLSTTGLTRAVREVSIAPKVGGQVVRLAVAEGQFVQKGDLLLKLDDRELRLALAERAAQGGFVYQCCNH